MSGETETTKGSGPADGTGARPRGEGFARGQTIGRYVVLDRLGAGGMGTVYAAYDPELDRRVALKLLHRLHAELGEARVLGRLMHRLFGDEDQAAASPGVDDRLLREAQAMARVSHPNVIAVHDVGTHEGQVFLAMELVQGVTLRQWLQASPRTWSEVIAVMMQAGRGLAAAHRKGLVHRDFKPDNVMVGDDGRVLVMDFGLVRVQHVDEITSDGPRPRTDALATDLTRTGTTVGTPAYMSPEQFQSMPIDPRSDQFSFCVALWEGVYGSRPFAARSLPELAAAVLSGRRVEPKLATGVPTFVRRVLDRGLALAPADRFEDLDALLAALARDPRQRRRRWLAVGGLLALAGGGAAAWRIAHVRALAGCDREGDAIDEHWDDRIRAEVETAMRTTEVPFATPTIAKFSPAIDDYAARWSAARVDACRAGLDGTQPPAIVAGMRDCLDLEAESLAALLEVAREADRKFVGKALLLAAELPPVERCQDVGWVVRHAPAERDASDLAIERQLVRVDALQAAGRAEPALAMAEGLLADAEAHGDPALIVRSRARVGALLERVGRHEDAERELTQAVLAAVELGEDAEAADAARRLAVVVALRLVRPAEGQLWARWAESLVERLGEEGDLRGARMHNELGVMARDLGRLDDALAHHTRALAILRERLGPEHPDVALSLNNLGTTLVDLGRLDDALASYEQARAIFVATFGEDHPDVANALSNEAEVYWRRGDLEQAAALMARVLAVNEAAFGPDHPRVAQSLTNLGVVTRSAKRPADAARQLERAVAIFERALGPDHPELANALGNLGDAERALGRLDDALAHHRRALAIIEEKLGPAHTLLPPILVGLGNDELAFGRPAAALAHFERARTLLAKTQPDHPDLGAVLLDLCTAQLQLGDADAALATAREAQERLDRGGASADQRATARRRLAEATWASGGSRSDVDELARAAQALYDPAAPERAEIDAWLATLVRP
ncbi:MAG: tetratricopeptide repeat protein [Deltaproteobacteria bacterium]|nr:tetratricopeptide repeat protein [Deltaproteobacteria bacterium]MBK8716401.1 tetratricopeptide repeat protein [Deltaproteobacteria bacterium]MBP7287878.1 tetratricopeptide repeat protein [Nannocystaceae bacterium]